jgi:hypothetical protein
MSNKNKLKKIIKESILDALYNNPRLIDRLPIKKSNIDPDTLLKDPIVRKALGNIIKNQRFGQSIDDPQTLKSIIKNELNPQSKSQNKDPLEQLSTGPLTIVGILNRRYPTKYTIEILSDVLNKKAGASEKLKKIMIAHTEEAKTEKKKVGMIVGATDALHKAKLVDDEFKNTIDSIFRDSKVNIFAESIILKLNRLLDV